MLVTNIQSFFNDHMGEHDGSISTVADHLPPIRCKFCESKGLGVLFTVLSPAFSTLHILGTQLILFEWLNVCMYAMEFAGFVSGKGPEYTPTTTTTLWGLPCFKERNGDSWFITYFCFINGDKEKGKR